MTQRERIDEILRDYFPNPVDDTNRLELLERLIALLESKNIMQSLKEIKSKFLG